MVDIGAVAPGAHGRGDAGAVVGHRRDSDEVDVERDLGGEGALLGVGGEGGGGCEGEGTGEGTGEGGARTCDGDLT